MLWTRYEVRRVTSKSADDDMLTTGVVKSIWLNPWEAGSFLEYVAKKEVQTKIALEHGGELLSVTIDDKYQAERPV